MRSNNLHKILIKLASLIMVSALFFCCNDDLPPLDHSPYRLEIRDGWEAVPIPDNNPLTVASVDFGRSLFFDKRLSIDSSISCADCHKAMSGFADSAPLSLGVNGRVGLRNSGALANVAYLPYFNRDGGVASLDRFALVPIEDHDEMNLNLLEMRDRLSIDPLYVHQAKEIYNRQPDAFAVSRALGSYLRTFISQDSAYDKYISKQDTTAMTAQQKRGMLKFFGQDAKCGNCHSGHLLTNHNFENNGLYQSYKGKDRGRQRVTDNPTDEGKFRVASLRNVALTAPYMHDGSLEDLPSVMDHYSNHGQHNINESNMIDEIIMTDQDKVDIIAFLKSLTDIEFINNEAFLDLEKVKA